MPATLDSAFAAVGDLVRRFEANQQRYLSPSYQEAEARKDFIDKFWKALGWDVDHDEQTNPAEQEVKIERGVAVATAQRRADYAFFLAPNFRDVRFFVEAKKPSVELNQNADAYFQTIRYGWNANTPLAVLTDFEQFHVLDCRAKPDIATATQRAHKTFRFTDFADREKFAEVYWLFAREALAAGAFDRYIAALPTPKEAARQYRLAIKRFQSVDASFLDELEQHRETLAKALKRDNEALDGFTLTEITQRVLDRLVFLRFLEDKLIEPEISVGAIARHPAPWAEFVEESRRLNARYNGAVYKPHPLIDTHKLTLGGDDFAEVCRALSDAHSPYNFDVVPIHILGSIYERFLGKVIVATDKRARVEDKPEVRKAGGVYYTPEYIVRYIVDHTVGKLIEGKTPSDIAKLRFADIACGSGSFLLAVFDTLLRYHTRWFNVHPDKAEAAGCAPTDDGAWRLSLKQRREILLNNVYGVDIDRQAVEVTQVSLYLKLLEDETTASAHQYALQLHETLLPNLSANIVCGNSLIGTDILSGQLFSSDEERALNPMDFEAAFPGVMRRGGFDAIVGNPPYVRIQTLNETNPSAVAYFGKTYRAAAKGNYDIYVAFVERGLSLLNANGALGYILPHKFFNAKYGEGLRGVISSGRHLSKIVHFGDQQVFAGATTYTALLFLGKRGASTFEFEKVKDLKAWAASGEASERGELDAQRAVAGEWNFGVGTSADLLDVLNSRGKRLAEYVDHIAQGIRTSANEVYVLEVEHVDRNSVIAFSRQLQSSVELERDSVQSFLQGREIRPYLVQPSGKIVVIPYVLANDRIQFIGESEMKRRFPKTYHYFVQNKVYLQDREGGRMRHDNWYAFIYPKNINVMRSPKILVPDIASRASFAFDDEGSFAFTSGYGIIVKREAEISAIYVLGLLNSKVLDFYLKAISTTMRGGFFRYFTQFVEQLPIRPINFADAADKAKYDKMVNLVEQMLDAKKKHAAAQSERDLDYYARRCDALDQQIDALVYDLYGLTDDEIAIVEGRA